MFEKDKRKQESYMKRRILSECGENATGEEVLNYLFNIDTNTYSDYVIYKYTKNKRTLFNRLNLIWLTPLVLVLYPFQWMLTGSAGFKRNSRIGKVIEKLVKFN